jgi:hypothetical protein
MDASQNEREKLRWNLWWLGRGINGDTLNLKTPHHSVHRQLKEVYSPLRHQSHQHKRWPGNAGWCVGYSAEYSKTISRFSQIRFYGIHDAGEPVPAALDRVLDQRGVAMLRWVELEFRGCFCFVPRGSELRPCWATRLGLKFCSCSRR